MGKNKKIYRLLVLLGFLFIALPAGSYFTLKLPSVQTWLGTRLFSRFSHKIEGEVQFSRLHFTYFNRVRVDDFLVRDFRGDTVLYAARLDAGIRRIKKSERLLRLGRIKVDNPVIRLRSDTSGQLNIAYYARLLVPEDTAKRNRELSINQLRIVDGTLSYSNGEKVSKPGGMIDPGNLTINNLDITIDDLRKLWKNVSLTLSECSLNTPEGLSVTNMFTQVDINTEHFYLIDPTIRTSGSFINSDIIGIDFVGRDDSFDFLTDGSLNIKFNSSLFALSDLGYFVPLFKGSRESVNVSGTLRGTVAELKGRNLDIDLSDTTHLMLDFDMSGLPDFDNTFMFIDIESFRTHTADIESFDIPGRGRIELGSELQRLGNISFSGNFTGFLTDFVTYGQFTTDLGELSTDILFKPDTKESFVYSGSLKIKHADMGKLTGFDDRIGFLSASFEVDGFSESFDHFRANLSGTIDSLQFKGYPYRRIAVDGLFTENIFDGSINSSGPNLKMDLLGRFDFSNEVPELDFSLNLLHANLYALNLVPEDSTARLSMLMTASVAGNNIDNITGEVRLLNSKVTRDGKELDLYDASLSSYYSDSTRHLDLETDFIDASLSGNFRLTAINDEMKRVVHSLAPALYRNINTGILKSDNIFSYDVRFKNSDRLNEFFNTGFQVAPGTFIRGDVEPLRRITLLAGGDYLTYRGNTIIDYSLDASAADTTTSLRFNSYRANIIDRLEIDSLTLVSQTLPDSIILGVNWKLPGMAISGGNINLRGSVTQGESDRPRFLAAFLPTTVNLNNKPWKISPSSIIIDSSSVSVENFQVFHNNDFIRIDGTISENPLDSLVFAFNNLDLAGLNAIKKQDQASGEDRVDFAVNGKLFGSFFLTDIYNNPLFESDIRIADFKTNEHEHGDVKLVSEWNNITKAAEILLYNDLDGARTFELNGYYDPSDSYLDLTAGLSEMPVDVLNVVLHSFASGVTGLATGKVRIRGELNNPAITGSVMARNSAMTIDYLQTRFNFSDSIRFASNGFRFDSIIISDDRGNRALLNGAVTHTAFNDFRVGLRIDADNMKVLETRQKDNNLFYGTAYASGVIDIQTSEENLDFSISARTERNTRIFIPLDASEEVSDYSFISFAEPRADTGQTRQLLPPVRIPEKSAAFGLDFNLDVTSDAEVQLVFDARVGDVMRARGSGNLTMDLGKDGNFAMYGDYTIEDGDYLLTLGNIFNKRFIVENGGSIKWNGDITSATIDIKAIYKLKASLFELLQDPNHKERIPVECHLNMSGQLVDPVIGFDIYLPTADEQTRTYVRNAINSDEEMSRQFLYLLVMNSFYPDPSFAAGANTSTQRASAMGVTTTEMLSNQLSNWLSQISNDFDIGFTYRPGNEISSQEVEVALSTQLLNDRVIINGNFDVAGQQQSTSTNDITGDFDVEVKLTEKVRLKVFNRSNDNILYETAPNTQGFGFFFRQEFNRFRDIFRRQPGEARKEEDVAVTPNGRGNSE